MGASGLIWAGIVLAWIAFLVPILIHRHDQRSDERSADGFSAAMRVLARRQAGADRGRRGDAADDDSGRTRIARGARPTRSERLRQLVTSRRATSPRPVERRAHRAGRRSAAARARRLLLLLAVLTVATAAAAFALPARIPGWAFAVPLALLVAYLAVLVAAAPRRARQRRGAVRRPSGARPIRADKPPGARADRPARPRRGDVGRGGPQPAPRRRAARRAAPDQLPAEDRAPLEPGRPLAGAVLVAGTHTGPGPDADPDVVVFAPAEPDHLLVRNSPAVAVAPVALAEPGDVTETVPGRDQHGWDPVPVPLPTYVTAPKATRAIRTVDLSAPGAWTSGHLGADEVSASAGDAASTAASPEALPHRPAVGD